MDQALAQLVAAATAFVGTHFALSHPLRAPLAKAFGERGFQAVYSIVALASFAWMVLAYRAMPPAAPLWDGKGVAVWSLASVLVLVGAVLFTGSFAGNPAIPAPNAEALAAKGPHGVFHVTRHPMMWGFALWAAAHILVSPSPRQLVLAGAVGLLALLGAHFQDRKKEAQMGAAWGQWEAATSYWPKLGSLGKVGALPLLGGLILWLAATWAHVWAIYVPAGVWRWVG